VIRAFVRFVCCRGGDPRQHRARIATDRGDEPIEELQRVCLVGDVDQSKPATQRQPLRSHRVASGTPQNECGDIAFDGQAHQDIDLVGIRPGQRGATQHDCRAGPQGTGLLDVLEQRHLGDRIRWVGLHPDRQRSSPETVEYCCQGRRQRTHLVSSVQICR